MIPSATIAFDALHAICLEPNCVDIIAELGLEKDNNQILSKLHDRDVDGVVDVRTIDDDEKSCCSTRDIGDCSLEYSGVIEVCKQSSILTSESSKEAGLTYSHSEYSDGSISNIYYYSYYDDHNNSSALTRNTTHTASESTSSKQCDSSRFEELYQKGKARKQDELKKSMEGKNAREHSSSCSIGKTLPIDQREESRRRLYELLKRDREFALERKMKILSARAESKENGDANIIRSSLPSSSSSPLSSISSCTSNISSMSYSSSRLDELYEKGKEQKRSDLKKSYEKKMIEKKGLLNVHQSDNDAFNPTLFSRRNFESQRMKKVLSKIDKDVNAKHQKRRLDEIVLSPKSKMFLSLRG
jgi:hypothetical protein